MAANRVFAPAPEKGLDLPYLRQVAESHRPEGVDLIILSIWGTLTNYRAPAPDAPAQSEMAPEPAVPTLTPEEKAPKTIATPEPQLKPKPAPKPERSLFRRFMDWLY
ncbi:MAG: hypothetical protein IAE94_11460 [Chthoniobacterales bacterium]|nr:hypothetical protein [Chthoniobacterales bacterium]